IEREGFVELNGFAGTEFDVGDADGSFGEAVFPSVEVRVNPGLSPMECIGRTGPRSASGFDLFDEKGVTGDENAVNAAFEFENEFGLFELEADGDFRLVAGGTLLLQTLVAARAFESAVASAEAAAGAEVAGAADEFDEFADGDGKGRLGGHGGAP